MHLIHFIYGLQTLRTCNSKHRVAATHLLTNVSITSKCIASIPTAFGVQQHGQMMSQIWYCLFSASACEMNKCQHEKLLSFSLCAQTPPKILDRNDTRQK